MALGSDSRRSGGEKGKKEDGRRVERRRQPDPGCDCGCHTVSDEKGRNGDEEDDDDDDDDDDFLSLLQPTVLVLKSSLKDLPPLPEDPEADRRAAVAAGIARPLSRRIRQRQEQQRQMTPKIISSAGEVAERMPIEEDGPQDDAEKEKGEDYDPPFPPLLRKRRGRTATPHWILHKKRKSRTLREHPKQETKLNAAEEEAGEGIQQGMVEGREIG